MPTLHITINKSYSITTTIEIAKDGRHDIYTTSLDKSTDVDDNF